MTSHTAVAVAAILFVASACKAKDPAAAATTPVAASPGDVPTTEQVAPAPVAEPTDPAAPAAACVDDRGCQGYLRCIQGVCEAPPAVTGVATEGMGVVAFVNGDAEVARFHVELAAEPWERTRGLMYRRKMDPDFGMLFVFESDSVQSFWMKNTYLPLDMVHINARGEVVGIVADAEPMTTSPRRTGKPARYVLELVAGAAARHGIEEGMTMKVENIPEGLSPSQ